MTAEQSADGPQDPCDQAPTVTILWTCGLLDIGFVAQLGPDCSAKVIRTFKVLIVGWISSLTTKAIAAILSRLALTLRTEAIGATCFVLLLSRPARHPNCIHSSYMGSEKAVMLKLSCAFISGRDHQS